MQKKLIEFWQAKQKNERFTASEWANLTEPIKKLVNEYPRYETYAYSFNEPYTKTPQVNEFGVYAKRDTDTPSESTTLLQGKWLIFLAKNAFAEKIQNIIRPLLEKDLIIQLKFRDYPICDEEDLANTERNFIIIVHEQKYDPVSAQNKIFAGLGIKPIFRFDLETRLDQLLLKPHLDYTYKNLDVQKAWLTRMQEVRAQLQSQGLKDLHDVDRAIAKIEQAITALQQ